MTNPKTVNQTMTTVEIKHNPKGNTMTTQYRLTEVNSTEDHPEAFDDVNKIARVFADIQGASQVIRDTRSFVSNADVRNVIPTVVERLSQRLGDTVINAEIASQVTDVEPSPTLSPEALAYIRNNSHAANVYSLNQVILDEDHSIHDNALDEEQVSKIAEEVRAIQSLLDQARSIYDAIVYFDVEPEDEDEDEDWDDEEYWDEDEDDWYNEEEEDDSESLRWF